MKNLNEINPHQEPKSKVPYVNFPFRLARIPVQRKNLFWKRKN
jgi:hypothetical protein